MKRFIPMNIQHYSLLILCGVMLTSASCSSASKVASKLGKKDTSTAVAEADPLKTPAKEPRKGFSFGKKYHSIDPFLDGAETAKAEEAMKKSATANPDIPANNVSKKNAVAKVDQHDDALPAKFDFSQSKAVTPASTQTPPANKVATATQTTTTPTSKSTMPSFEGYATTNNGSATNTTSKPAVEEITIGKIGYSSPNAPSAPTSIVTKSETVNPFAPSTSDNKVQTVSAQVNCPQNCPPDDRGAGLPLAGAEWPSIADYNQPVNPQPKDMADEYLFDGGDRSQKVYKDKLGRHGLNSEDTVAEYKDHNGQTHIKESNRVAVYSPKFGAVSSMTEPVIDGNVNTVMAADNQVKTTGLDAQTTLVTGQKNDQMDIASVRSGPSGIEHNNEMGSVTQNDLINQHTKLSNPFMERNNQYGVQAKLDQVPVTTNSIISAVMWSRAQNPIVVATTTAGNEVYSRFREQELVGVEERKTPGNLRIIKHADRSEATRGEIITFTIEFENVGDLPLSEVRIIDNLTPRLQFVQGSSTCNVEGKLDVQDNGEGSLVLRWELAEPLQGHSKGVVSFQAQVN